MKTYKYILINQLKVLLVTCALSLIAIQSRGLIVFSEPTNGLYVGVSCASDMFSADTRRITNNIPIPYNDELAVLYLCNTGSVDLLIPQNKEFSIKFQMHDKTGNVIAKTPLGELWGGQVTNYPSKPSITNNIRMSGWSAASWDSSKPVPSWPRLVSADKLFLVKEKGIYDLTLEVHLMQRRILETTNSSGMHEWTWDHIAIPPVTIKVEKP